MIRQITSLIEHIIYECINPNGKVGILYTKLAIFFSILATNIFLFYGYTMLVHYLFRVFLIEKNILTILIILCFYQYVFIHILAYLIHCLYCLWKRKKGQVLSFNLKYLDAMLKNNTYKFI